MFNLSRSPKVLVKTISILTLVSAIGLLLPSATSAQGNPHFSAQPINDRVEGWQWPEGANVILTIDVPDYGTDVDYSDTKTVGIADWDPDETWVDFDLREIFDLQAGHILTMSDGVTTKTHTVTSLTVTNVDADTDVVSGTAATDSEVYLWIHDDCCSDLNITADGAGDWIAAYSGIFDLAPGTRGSARQEDDDGDNTRVDWQIANPNIEAQPIYDRVEGRDWPDGASVTLTIDVPGYGTDVDYSATKTVGFADWDPNETWVDFDLWEIFDLQTGHILTMSDGVTTKTHIVINLDVTDVDADTDVISGTAAPDSEVYLWIHDECCSDLNVSTDSTGNWIADLSGIYDVAHGTRGSVKQNDDDWDSTRVDWWYWDTMFNVLSGGIWYGGWDYETTLTLTIDDPATPETPDYTTTFFVDTPDGGGIDFVYDDTYYIPGNIYTLTDGVTTKTHVLVYIDQVWADPATNIVSGYAEVGETVHIRLPWEDDPGREVLVTSGDGYWEVDYSGEIDITPGFFGFATIVDEDGDATQFIWNALDPQIEVYLEDDRVTGFDFQAGATATLTIDDPGTGPGVDYTYTQIVQSNTPWDDPRTFVQFFLTLDIQVGFVITLSDGASTKTHIVNNIQVTLVDTDADILYGTADPFALVETWIHEPVCCINREVTADGDGNWMVDFSVPGEDWMTETFDIDANTSGQAVQRDEDGDSTNFNWYAPPTGLCTPGDSISGFVFLADGATPASNVTLHIEDYYTGEELFIAQPDGSGYYNCDLPDGDYRLWAFSDGYSREFYDETIYESAALVHVDASTHLTGVNFTLDLPGVINEWLIFNLTNPILSEFAVREAISHGTNRPRMIAETWPESPMWHSYLSPLHWAYPESGLPQYPFDPALAMSILDAAGWVDSDSDGVRDRGGVPLHLVYVTLSRSHRLLISELFAEDMAAIGIEIEIVVGTWSRIQQGDFEITQIGWGDDLNDWNDWPGDFFVTGSTGNYSNPAADELMADARALSTRAERLPFLQQHQILVMSDLSKLSLVQRCISPDIDCDMITDIVDNAPNAYNPDQFDLDSDGVGDVADVCPSDPTDTCNTDNSTSESVGSGGGSLSTPQGSVGMEVPAGALGDETSMSITDTGTGFVLNTDLGEATAVFAVEIGPPGTTFETPVTITFTWDDVNDDGMVDGTAQVELDLFISKDGIAITDVCAIDPGCDAIANTFSFEVSRLSEFALVTLNNQAPHAEAGGPYTTDEGSAIMLDASGSSDPDGDPLTYEWDLDNDGEYDDDVGVTAEATFADDGVYTVGIKVTDPYDASDTTLAEVVVNNVAPVVGEITAPLDPVQVGALVEASASFSDPGADEWTATWDWGDEMSSEGIITDFDVTGSHTYDTPGVYTLTLTISDDDGEVGTTTYQYIVVYDPEGGFVTGGGWIDSPEGAYTPDPTLSGKATFGFVAKYKKGADIPSGVTEFRFQVADLNFQSTSYDWLVVAGARAQFKGVGTINGAGEYGFLLTAIDGEINGGGGVDKFRIKIWDIASGEVVYDNQMGDVDDVEAATELGGGSIVIHKAK